MPFIGIGLSTLIAIGLAIHAIRTGQERYWLLVLFIFPLLGSVVYVFAILLPSLRNTRSAYQLTAKFRQIVSPHKTLKAAQAALDISPTVDNQVRLANALVDNNRAAQALPYYEQALSGIYKTAPDILLQYAKALYLSKNYPQALTTLNQLRATHANYCPDQSQLLYADILVKLGEKQLAQQQFNSLMAAYPDLEVLCRYLQALIYWQEFAKAKQLLQDYQIRLKQMPKHARQLNRQWIKQIEKAKAQLP